MMNPYEPSRSQIRRLRFYEAGCFLFVIGSVAFAILLYILGSSNRWERYTPSSQEDAFRDVEQVTLLGGGDWLVWVSSGTGNSSDTTISLLGGCDLSHPGRSVFLRPPPNTGVHPIEVLEGDLITLVTIPQVKLWEIIYRGWNLLTTKTTLRDTHQEKDDSTPWPTQVTIHLQRVNLTTGRVITTAVGGTYIFDLQSQKTSSRPSPTELTDFERGFVSLSPDRLNLAWWSAREEVGKSPLSATVTENLQILSTGPKFRKLFGEVIQTDGTLSIRSRLLQRIGQPVWISNDRCLLLSTLDAGSLIPFDCGEGTTEAAISLRTLRQTLSEGTSLNNFDPEDLLIIPGDKGQEAGVLVWLRLPGALHFFMLDPLFHLIHHTQVDDRNLDLSHPLWLKKSQILLVEDNSSSRLVGFTGRGEREGVYPIPPDWAESFQILGENREGDLIGYNRGSFLKTKSGDGAWETMDLFP